MARCGIYKLVNQINGKKYIGSSNDVHRRLKEHKRQLLKGNHCNAHLQSACLKYGISSFKAFLITTCDRKELLSTEQRCLDAEDFSKLYNIKTSTSGGFDYVNQKLDLLDSNGNKLLRSKKEKDIRAFIAISGTEVTYL